MFGQFLSWYIHWILKVFDKLSTKQTNKQTKMLPLLLNRTKTCAGFRSLRSYKMKRGRAPAPRAWPGRSARCTRTCPHPRWPPGVRAEAGPVSARRSACPNAASRRSLWSSPPLYRNAGCPARCVPGRRRSPCGRAWRGSWGWRAGTGSGRTWS